MLANIIFMILEWTLGEGKSGATNLKVGGGGHCIEQRLAEH